MSQQEKVICDKPIANIMINSEKKKMKAFPPKSEIRQEKEIKDI